MADIDEKGDRGISVKSESVAIRTPDAQEARNAAASEIKAFQGLNKNAHNGSAGGDQDLSFELVAFRGDGQAKVVAARQTERLESVSMEELILKGRNGDKFAVSIVQQMRAASDLPEDQRSQAREKLQDTADKMYGRSAGSDRISEQLKHVENIDTQTMQALAPSNEVARSALEMRENIEKHVPAGPERDKLITQLKTDITPILKEHVEQNVYRDQEPNEWKAFKNLTQEQQTEVIRILNNASLDTIDDLDKQNHILDGKPVVDFVLSIDRAVRALGTANWTENISLICRDLQKIATGQPIGQQKEIEKIVTIGIGTFVKTVQGVDQVGQHAHPRAFVHDTHATAEEIRQDIFTASQYFGEKIKNNNLGSIPNETADAANYAKEQTTKAIEEFPGKDSTDQANTLGAAATVIFFMAATREFIDKTALSKQLGIGIKDLAVLTDEQLEARGVKRLPAHENIVWSQRGKTTYESVVRKLDGYLLDPEHIEGGPKARWLKAALGFDTYNAEQLATQLLFDETKAVAKDLTIYGQKYEQLIDLKGANGRIISTPVVWIKNPDNITRLVTLIPVNR
jgi:hypothetical protein